MKKKADEIEKKNKKGLFAPQNSKGRFWFSGLFLPTC